MGTLALIEVKFELPGIHYWPDAPPEREYLGKPHRHLFHFELALQVKDDDREVEYHDLLDDLRTNVGKVAMGFAHGMHYFGPMSCETIARKVLRRIQEKYGSDRSAIMKVGEDGEFNAILYYNPGGALP